MKKLFLFGISALVGYISAETAEEAYARLSSHRSLWETNAMAYAKMSVTGKDPVVAEAKASRRSCL